LRAIEPHKPQRVARPGGTRRLGSGQTRSGD